MLFDGVWKKSDLCIFSLLNHNMGETQYLVYTLGTHAHIQSFLICVQKNAFYLSIVLKTTLFVMIKYSIKFSKYPFGGVS